MLNKEPTGESGITEALWQLGRSNRNSRVIVVCSDMLAENWAAPLRALAATRRVIVVEPFDQMERVLPPLGTTMFSADEIAAWLDTDDPAVRKAFEKYSAERLEKKVALIRSCGATHVPLECSSVLETSLRPVLAALSRRNIR